jgi:hypothetical protein
LLDNRLIVRARQPAPTPAFCAAYSASCKPAYTVPGPTGVLRPDLLGRRFWGAEVVAALRTAECVCRAKLAPVSTAATERALSYRGTGWIEEEPTPRRPHDPRLRRTFRPLNVGLGSFGKSVGLPRPKPNASADGERRRHSDERSRSRERFLGYAPRRSDSRRTARARPGSVPSLAH